MEDPNGRHPVAIRSSHPRLDPPKGSASFEQPASLRPLTSQPSVAALTQALARPEAAGAWPSTRARRQAEEEVARVPGADAAACPRALGRAMGELQGSAHRGACSPSTRSCTLCYSAGIPERGPCKYCNTRARSGRSRPTLTEFRLLSGESGPTHDSLSVLNSG